MLINITTNISIKMDKPDIIDKIISIHVHLMHVLAIFRFHLDILKTVGECRVR